VLSLIAQASQTAVAEDNNGNNRFVDIDDLIDSELGQLTTTQLGIERLEDASDTYLPGTLPPRLYQSNPFAQQTEPTEMGEIQYQLTAQEVPATAQEIQAIEEEEADEEALSQAVETLIQATRSGRKRTATTKVISNEEQARQNKMRKTGGRGGRGGRSSGQRV
jgi:hypothetical protein